MKTSYELAMERLRKQDREAGIEERALTDDQKAEIGEVRRVYKAKIAQEEVMYESKMRATVDPGERETLQLQIRHDRERLTSEQETKIEKIRQRPS